MQAEPPTMSAATVDPAAPTPDAAKVRVPSSLPGQRSGANRAVKCRSCLGWDTMRMPGRSAARPATRVTASIT